MSSSKLLGSIALCSIGGVIIVALSGSLGLAFWGLVGVGVGLYCILVLVNRVEGADSRDRERTRNWHPHKRKTKRGRR